MKKLKKLFVPCSQSRQLKELGFDEPCFGIFIDGNFNLIFTDRQVSDKVISAPIFAQAFEFFREKYNLFGQVNIHTYFIYDISTLEIVKEYDKLTKTYKETELACLIKLIDIVKARNIGEQFTSTPKN